MFNDLVQNKHFFITPDFKLQIFLSNFKLAH